MNEISKQLDKDLSKVFFNSVEEMNECYGIDAELPSNLHNNTDLVCYEIVEPFTYDEVCQYKFDKCWLKYLSFGMWSNNLNNIDNEILLNSHDYDIYEGRCFVYVRVNDYLRKHLEKSLLGCEFVSKNNESYYANRRFTKRVDVLFGKLVILDQFRFSTPLESILLYPDDHSDPIPYQEWVKQINKQDVELED